MNRTTIGWIALIALIGPGCVGGIRDTTTPRSSSEMLLISSAAERAVSKYQPEGLGGKKVFIDDSRFDSVDKSYVIAALRYQLARNDVGLAGDAGGADVVLQIRNATLGIWGGDFTLGIPALQMSGEGFGDTVFFLPPLSVFRRLSHQGFAKLQIWEYEGATKAFTRRSPDLWGHSYYNQWWVLNIGPFDGSNDVYPDDLPEWEDGTAKIVEEK